MEYDRQTERRPLWREGPLREERIPMEGFFNALSASLVLLLLMSVGYFMGRLGWMTAAEKKFLGKYIIT